MPTNIIIPSAGESVTEGVVSSWLKPEGSYVQRDDEVLEVETDKVNQTILAPAAGVIKHMAQPGQKVLVGQTVGTIDESAPAPAGGAAPAPAAKPTAPAAPKAAEPARTAAPAADIRATPLARKVAEEKHIDLSKLAPTGPGGRVREQDVTSFIESGKAAPAGSAPAAAAPSSGNRATRRERMSPLRQRIAVRLVEAQHTAAMLTTFNECDMTNVMELRSRHKDAFEKQHGVKLGFMSFFIKAAVAALKKYPLVNASIVTAESGDSEIEHHDYCDIAVAVGTEKGLVVPVVRNCEALSMAGVEKAIADLAVKAKNGKLTLEDLQGGTFTISNGGVYGSLMSTPILNPPQSGILGMHNIVKRPVEDPTNPGQIALRPMMYLALSYDHRIVDGAGAVGFLKTIKECIEDPARLVLEV